MNQIGVTILLLCCCASNLAFVYEDCGSEVGKFNEIVISSCDTSEDVCGFERGTEVTVTVKFTPSKDISSIEMRAYGIMMDEPVRFPVENADVCKDPNSGIECPLKQDQEVVYKSSYVLEKNIPPISLDAMWEFRNENDEKIFCVRLPIKIK